MPIYFNACYLRCPVLISNSYDLSLPTLDKDSQIRMNLLHTAIQHEIAKSSGWISFSQFMEIVLYKPKLGYYTGPARKFGNEGDFITAPHVSPIFGATIANQIAEVLDYTKDRQVIELGAGDGSAAADIMIALEKIDSLPSSYSILDVSPSTKKMQLETLSTRVPHLLSMFQWLDDVPMHINGVIFANEVFDALPVSIVEVSGSSVLERGVEYKNNRFLWCKRQGAHYILEAVKELGLQSPYITEINFVGRALMRKLASNLDKGMLLIIDYGFKKEEFYHPQRSFGTLMCHYKHHSHQDPFVLLGLQDITSHVDFSNLAKVGEANGLDLIGFCNQAQFLINCGITDLIAEHNMGNGLSGTNQASKLNKLLSPAEMGELFKVLALGKGLGETVTGFSAGNRRISL